MGLGVAIGAITFSGSVIAFLKLNGNMSGKPILLPLRHVINLGTIAAILGLIAYFTQDQSPWVFWTVAGLSFLIGFLLIIPIGGADMPVVISMLNSLFRLGGGGDGVHAAQQRDDHHRGAGRKLGRDPQLHHVPGDEPQLHLGDRRRFRRRCGRGRGGGGDRPAVQARLGRGRRLPDEAGRPGGHRPRLRNGGQPGAARAARDGRPAQEGGRAGQICDPSRSRGGCRGT